MPSTAAPGPASDHAAPRHLSQSECGLLEDILDWISIQHVPSKDNGTDQLQRLLLAYSTYNSDVRLMKLPWSLSTYQSAPGLPSRLVCTPVYDVHPVPTEPQLNSWGAAT
ncbi:hypothetical protein CSAL01_11796 [Colletotrichum salicis]|uniref:Uncharacterized protein n=1 Tax=Colletotrichum salicis TaxID=1209931 RepID=A0A135U3T0_9PEZI|nr:hypothetical protein CSAL01_11796 [Colletotrichum salicis]